MRNLKSYENSLYSSDELKSRATNVKHLLGGLKNIDKSMLEMDAKELKQLSDAISLVSKISEHYGEASRFKKRVEKAEAVELEKIKKLVNASAFAQLTTVGDKVAFISHGTLAFILATSDVDAWHVRYCLTRSYEESLSNMNYSIAAAAKRTSKTYQEVLDEAWVKFQESLPERHKRYAGLIERMEKLLAEDLKMA